MAESVYAKAVTYFPLPPHVMAGCALPPDELPICVVGPPSA